MRYWDTLLETQRKGVDVIVDKSWEDCRIRDLFDDTCCDIEDLESKVNSGELEWFMLRARVLFQGHELSSNIVGGFLYEDAREVLTDGTADDLIWEALREAQGTIPTLVSGLQAILVDELTD